MKRKIFFLLLCQLLVTSVFAQVQVQKSLMAAKETNVFNANQGSALNTRTGQTLVVWQKLSTTASIIVGRIVNAQGSTASPTITLATTLAAAHPSVAYNPARNEFMLAYDDNPAVELRKTSVYLQRLNAQGRPSGTPVKVSIDTVSTDLANFFPRVLFNPKTNAYTLFWLREITSQAQADDGTNGMVGALVTPAAVVSGPVVMIQKTVIEGNRLWGPIPLDAAYQPIANGKVLVVFVQVATGSNASQANYYLATLDPSLNAVTASNIVKINNAVIQLTSGFAWGARMALFSNLPGFVFFSDSANVKKRKIDLQGKLSGAQTVAFKAPKNNTKMVYPSVAFATNSKGTRGLLLATQDAFRETGEASTWAQLLDANAAPIGAPVRVDVTSATDTALSGNLTALPLKATDTLFRFAGYYTLAQFKAPGQTYENSGIVKLNINVTVP